MSQRLKKYGRYPKNSGVEQTASVNSQFPQPTPAATSQMPFFDPSLQPQTDGQNAWTQPLYSNPNTYQQNHVPRQAEYPNPNSFQQNPATLQSVPQPGGYWSGGQMHAPPSQPQWNESWNYKPENLADSTAFTNYQQPEPTPVAEQWQQIPYSQIDNQNFPPQSLSSYNETSLQGYQYPPEYQPTNNNSNVSSSNMQLPTWENGSLNATQPEHLPWTYSSPQYSDPTPPAVSVFSQSAKPTTNTISWPLNSNYVSSVSSDFTSDASPATYLNPNPESVVDPSSASESRNSSPCVDPERSKDSDADATSDLKSENVTVISDGTSAAMEQPVNVDYAASTLSAFFQDVDQSELGNSSEPDSSTTPVLQAVGETSSQEGSSPVPFNESSSQQFAAPGSSVGEETHSDDETSFVQKENVIDLCEEEKLESNTGTPAGFNEEPINQEVPEPPQNESSNVVSQSKKEYNEILAEEPPNQQIPAKSGQTSRSTSAERERLVIRPREDSPFKPPRPSSSKGIVVQQEIAIQSHTETKHPEGNTVVQEVNLETFPDNLERPSDYEELRKQSPLYVAHKHLRSELNSSPSSLLCDNLDIPCVTLAPAAPPLSSSKSDKSESSTSSRAESLSLGKSNLSSYTLNESNSSSLAGDSLETDTCEKSSSKKLPGKTMNSILPSTAKDFQNPPVSEIKKYDNRPAKPARKEKINPEKADPYRPVYLKDSKINGNNPTSIRETESLRQHSSNSDLSNAGVAPHRSSQRDADPYPDERADPRYCMERLESSRQKKDADLHPEERADPRYCMERLESSRQKKDADPYPEERADPRYSMERLESSRQKRDADPYPDERADPRYSMDRLESSRQKRDADPYPDERADPRYSMDRLESSRQKRDADPYPDERADPRYSMERLESSRQRFSDQKYPSFDERQYYADRERSRPSSRSSLRERPDDYPYQPKADDYSYPPSRGDPRRYPPDYPPRPSSRISETDVGRNDRQGYGSRQPYPYPPSNYPRGSDYYQRPSNQRGYEYDPYQRDPYYSSYYDAYRYAYSNYNYGYYDEIYRNDPRYQQYQEQYRQYYAKYGYDVDYDRSSGHSGRSSANELSKGNSSSNYPEPDIDSINSEYSAYNPEQAYDNDQNEISNIEAILDQASTPSSRLTPVKFSYAHPIARFSPGGLLITAIPSQTSTVPAMPIRIHNIQAIREEEESFQELKNYQGPLIRGSTHKNDVIEFCTQKIKASKLSDDIVDRDSYILLWELMVLLLRQNGSVAGSDIAELLLKDHEVLRPPSLLKQAIETPLEHSPAEVNDSSSQSHAGDTSSPDEGIVVLHDKTLLNTPQTVDVDKLTRKFREFLLFGHKKDALEWAMKHGLWGHALFLASKMDLRTYANVMTRFANSLALNDPLQTLYQLMSGRQPIAVTNVADKRWGDWRPHLAMILSNPSSHPDVDSRSITTLGDTLASRGCICAAHFCYIMAQVEFGTYEQKNSKLVLLTADHMLPFEEFATNEAIQVTEIYEYAQSLANSSFMLVHLQLYKFWYALRLVEHGFFEEALHYCEIIASKLQAHPHLFQLDFISEIFKYATLLKYHDPHFMRGQGEFEDQDDPDWLKNLSTLVQNFNNFNLGDQTQPYFEQQQEVNQQQNANLPQQFSLQSTDNVSCQNVPSSSMQNEMINSYNHVNTYQPTPWNQQNSLTSTSFSTNGSQLDNVGYYQSDLGSNQGSFHRQNSIPSHEENETTDVPSSPVTQTPPFDYYSGGTQQEWSSAYSLPSVSLSDVDHCHSCPKSDLEALVRKDETESDVALCSSSHSTPLHNYLLSNDDSEDRRMLMTQSGLVDVRTLNSCLKSSRSHSRKHKKCIKFDSSVSGHQSRLQRPGIRRRKFNKKENEGADASDSSQEGSPSKDKGKSHHKLSLLASLGLLRNSDGSAKLSKRKRKAKKKNETIEKLLQSKKTFAIDEPCETDEKQWVAKEKSMDESVQETKKIITILKKLTDEEKKNSQLSQLMANEFHKKPPLIFGGTYPIDEPCESLNSKLSVRKSKTVLDGVMSSHLAIEPNMNTMSKRSKCSTLSSHKSVPVVKKTSDVIQKQGLARISPITMFKRMHHSGKKFLQSKEDISNTSLSTTASSSSNPYKYEKESRALDSKPMYESSNTFSNNATRRERRDSALSSGSRYSTGSISMANKSSAKEVKQDQKKDKQATQAGKTWLGGIFSRLMPKAPNQMILPDDKNPTIVWDDVKNCWVNKDSNDDDETNAPVAPPTDMELMGTKSSIKTFQAPGTSMPPSSNSVPPASASHPVNKFQRPKTKGMRQNYVDVLNTSGSTKKTVLSEGLFPTPYENFSSQQQMFTPAPTSTSGGENSAEMDSNYTNFNSTQFETGEQAETHSTPLMFDPSEFDARRSSINNQRLTLGRTGRRTYPT